MEKLSPRWRKEFKNGKTYFLSETQKVILNKDISDELVRGQIPLKLLEKSIYIENNPVKSKESVIKYAEYIRLYETPGSDSHQRMISKNVMIVGLGGIGSEISLILSGSGVEKFIFIDTDLVEENNFNRQFLYTRADIGAPKVKAASEALKKRHQNLEFKLYHNNIKCVKKYIRWDDVDFVVVAFDKDTIHDQVDFMEYCWNIDKAVIYVTTGFDKSYMSPVFKKGYSKKSPKEFFSLSKKRNPSNVSASSGALNSYASAIAAEQICYYLADIYEKVEFNNMLISFNNHGYPLFKKFSEVNI